MTHLRVAVEGDGASTRGEGASACSLRVAAAGYEDLVITCIGSLNS